MVTPFILLVFAEWQGHLSNALEMDTKSGTGSTVSTGTTPSSLCSTPNLLSGANPMMQYMQQGYPAGLHQVFKVY